MSTTFDVLNKLASSRIETKIAILELLQCANAVESRCCKKGVKGQLGPKKIKVYGLRWFWALHVFEDDFRGIGIFEDAFGKSPSCSRE